MVEKSDLIKELADIRAMYTAQSMGNHLGFGKTPAVLVVDFQKSLADPNRDAGANMDAEVLNTAKLLDKARAKGVPVIFVVTTYDKECFDGGLWTVRMPSVGKVKNGTKEGEVDDRLNLRPGEKVFVKKYTSSFIATGLASFLTAKCIDTLIVTGCTTSGCIRATVTDSLCSGFRTIIPRECVHDRHWIPHEVNLMDMDIRYADVIPLQKVLDHLDTI